MSADDVYLIYVARGNGEKVVRMQHITDSSLGGASLSPHGPERLHRDGVEVASVEEAKEIIDYVDGLRLADFQRGGPVWMRPEYGTSIWDLTRR